MNKPPFRAAKFCPAAAGAALFLLPHTALGQTSDITCTAAPDCASLGYTKSVDQCPDGGMKCPFDSSKMFCVSAGNMGLYSKTQLPSDISFILTERPPPAITLKNYRLVSWFMSTTARKKTMV